MRFLKTIQQFNNKTIRRLRLNRTVRFTILGSLFLIIGLSALTIYLQTNHSAEAAWYNSNWNYREAITITNSSGGTLTNIQKAIQINTSTLVTAGKLQGNCQDLRFTDSTGTVLSYYIDSGCNTSTTNIWLIIPTLNSGVSTLYVYYGNPSSAQGSTTNGFDNVIGLQGYWTMNESSGSTVADSTVNANNGTSSGTSIVSGEIGNGLSFNGSTANVQVPDMKNAYPITVEAWVKPSSSGTTFVYSSDANNAADILYIGGSNKFSFGIDTANNSYTDNLSTFTSTVSQWHQVIWVYDGATLTGYVDGQLAVSAARTGSLVYNVQGTDHIIGAYKFNGSVTQGFLGTIDDVKYYTTARSASQILSDYQNPAKYTIASAGSVPTYSVGSEQVGTGPAAYWTFDEGYGTNANDNTSGGNNGMLNAIWQTSNQCQEGNCVLFDGTDNYVNLGNPFDIGTASCTLTAWFKANDVSTTQDIVSKGGHDTAGYPCFDIALNAGDLVVYDQYDTPNITISNIPVVANTWYHVAIVRDATGKTFTVYLNGVQKSQTTLTVIGNATVARNLFLGAVHSTALSGNVGLYYNGKIDNVRYYNAALTSPEVQQDYGLQTVSPAPVDVWKLNEGSGTSITDSSGSVTGTLTGSAYAGPTWQTADQCISSKCLSFNGSNNEVIVGNVLDASVFTVSNAKFSVSGWAKTSSLPGVSGGGNIVAKSAGGVGPYEWYINHDHDGYVKAFVASDTSEVNYVQMKSATTIPTNTWFFYTLVFDGSLAGTSKVTLYVNSIPGVLAGSAGTLGSSCAASSQPITLGADFHAAVAPQNTYNGYIDDVKIYPYARTASQVKTDFVSRGSVNAGSNVLGASGQSNINALNNGLVGYYKLDETSGNATDSSGNSNTGTATGTTVVGGEFGNGRSFNGTSDKFDVGSNPSTLQLTGSVTISAWIKLTTNNAVHDIVSKDAASGQFGYRLYTDASGKLNMEVSSDGTTLTTVTGATTISTGTWYHVAGIYNPNKSITVFVNGVQDATNTNAIPSSLKNSSADVEIGSQNTGGSNFMSGSIDEARIYNRALSPADIQSLYTFTPGPIATYNFEEGTGSTVNDTSGNGNTVTWNGTLGSQWVSGKIGNKAGNFNGSDNYLNIGNKLSFTGASSQQTISFWIKPNNISSGFILERDLNYAVFFNGSNVIAYDQLSSDNSYHNGWQFSGNMVKGNWYHVAITYDGTGSGGVRMYLNGVAQSVGLAAYNGGWNDSGTGGLYVGSRDISGTPSVFYNGALDDVNIYNYAISQKQVIQDMNAGGSSTSTDPAPVGYWKFDEGYGTTAHNTGNAGSMLDGTLTNMASPATATSGWQMNGKFGKALSFDGSNDYLLVTENSALHLGTNPFSISAWFKTTTTGAVQYIYGKDQQSNPFPFVALFITANNKLNFVDSDCGTAGCGWGSTKFAVVSTKTVTDGQWHQAVGVRLANGNLLIYIDGVLNNTLVQAAMNGDANTTNLDIGGDGAGGELFSGQLDDVKLYTYSLTQQEVNLDYNHNSGISMGSLGTAPDGKTASNSASAIYCVPGDTTSCAAPVAEYNFEEATGTSVNDTSGNANTGTWNGTLGAQWKQSKPSLGWAGKFNGTNNYVDVGQPSDLNFTNTSTFTISAWIKANQDGDIFTKEQTNSPYTGYEFIISSGTLDADLLNNYPSSGLRVNTTPIVTDNKWHYVVLSYNGNDSSSGVQIYLDGTPLTVSAFENNLSGSLSTATDVNIGGRANNGTYQPFGGLIDQLRVYNYVRTPAQVAWDYNHGGPVGWWKMDECQGTVANDASGNGNTGTITISASGTQTSAGTCTDGLSTSAWNNGATGKFNSSLSFDGTDDYMSAPDTALLDPNSVTVSAWIYDTLVDGNYHFVVSKGNDNAHSTLNYGIRITSSNTPQFNYYTTGGLSLALTGSSALSTNRWYLISATYNATTAVATLYVNGTQVATQTVGSGNLAPGGGAAQPLSIGEWLSGGGGIQSFKGQIDDVRVYNYPLTQLQVKLLYNDGAAVRFAPLTGTP